MTIRTISAAVLTACLIGISGALTLEAGTAKDDLDALVAEVTTKLKAGQQTEAELADEIARFDVLLKTHGAEKTDEVAQILVMKALLYVQVLDQPEAAVPMFRRIKAEFPNTEAAGKVDAIVAQIEMKARLSKGKPFPGFSVEDLDGKSLSLDDYKGRVVLVDFWATWCGPCVAELPNVLDAYKAHHEAGFDIVGISLDSDQGKLKRFIAEHDMPWRQYFDGRGWKNKLAREFGVSSIPATFLLDGEGVIIGKNLRGPALGQAVAEALAR